MTPAFWPHEDIADKHFITHWLDTISDRIGISCGAGQVAQLKSVLTHMPSLGTMTTSTGERDVQKMVGVDLGFCLGKRANIRVWCVCNTNHVKSLSHLILLTWGWAAYDRNIPHTIVVFFRFQPVKVHAYSVAYNRILADILMIISYRVCPW